MSVINASDKPINADDILVELDLTNYISSGIYTVNLLPKFKEELPWAYFPHETGYSVTFELVEKTMDEKAGE